MGWDGSVAPAKPAIVGKKSIVQKVFFEIVPALILPG
jgi:hypothetical protein